MLDTGRCLDCRGLNRCNPLISDFTTVAFQYNNQRGLRFRIWFKSLIGFRVWFKGEVEDG